MAFLFTCCNTATAETAEEVVIEQQCSTTRAAPAEAEADVESFTCLVKREEGEWGMVCDSWGDCIQIIKVNDGKVKAYNDAVEAELQLSPGDIIVQIDGKDVHKESLPELKTAAQAEFKVVRPPRRSVNVTKENSDKWGLKMTYQNRRSCCLRVNAVNEGGMKAYNTTADMPAQVKETDFIVGVNGCQEDPQKMLEVFRGCSEVDMTIMRLEK